MRALTTVVTVLLAVVPGALLGFVVPAGRDRWVAWSTSPILTLGLVTISMGWLRLLGMPDGALPVLVVELVLAAAAVAVASLVRHRRPRDTVERSSLRPVTAGARRLDLASLGSAWVVVCVVGWGILGRLPAPPGWDAMNHAFLTRRIIDTGSTAISHVCVSGVTDPVASCSFYPLAADVQWAQGALLSGGQISDAMGGWSIFVAPLALATAVYACVRLLGAHPIVAGSAAAAPAFIGPLWWAMRTGRVTEQAGAGLAIGVALLVAVAVTSRRPVRMGLLAGVAAAGLVMTHTYEVLVVLVFGLAFIWVRHRTHVSGLVRGGAAIAVGGFVAIVPFIGSLLGANAERRASPPRYVGQLGDALRFWLYEPARYVLFGYPEPNLKHAPWSISTRIALCLTIAVLIASLAAPFLRRLRWVRPWFITWAVFTGVGIWTSYSDSAAAQGLAGLWYGVRERLRTMITPVYGVLAIAGACVIALAVQALRDRLRDLPRRDAVGRQRRGTAVASLALLVPLTVLAAVPGSWHPIRDDLVKRAPQGPAYDRVYRWLAANTAPGKVVAYDRNRQFMTWSYADYGVDPLFGIPPVFASNKKRYNDRYAAFQWLANSKGARAAGCEVDRFGVEYVAVGGPPVPGWPADYKASKIATSPNVSLVHRDGRLRVYRVTDAGRACPR